VLPAARACCSAHLPGAGDYSQPRAQASCLAVAKVQVSKPFVHISLDLMELFFPLPNISVLF